MGYWRWLLEYCKGIIRDVCSVLNRETLYSKTRASLLWLKSIEAEELFSIICIVSSFVVLLLAVKVRLALIIFKVLLFLGFLLYTHAKYRYERGEY